MSDLPPYLAARGVAVRLGGAPVLSGVDLAARRGELVAVVGPNGAGKTTLLRACAGLLAATGDIRVGGGDLRRMPARARAERIAYLPQGHVFHWPLSVADIVGLGRLPKGSGADLSRADRDAVARAMRAAGVEGLAGRTVTTLSGGERARVALARVLATEAPLVLADEPIAALDLRYQILVLDLLRRNAAEGTAVVAVLHDLGLAARYADRVVMLAGGRLVGAGPPADVLAPALIAETFGVEVAIHDAGGIPVVVPLRLS